MSYNPKDYYFFWRGPISQWVPSTFKDDDGIEYCCAEQYMMYQKAVLFKDQEIANEIMSTTSPRKQQELGRQVANFDLAVWNENAKRIVYQGNVYKFTQNEHLKEMLIEIGDKKFVEASPIDKIWGIGLDEDHAMVTPPEEWEGTNWLGEVITDVSRLIRG